MLTLDGRQGEGGGQVLRIALALAAITGTPFRIHNIRGGRAKSGLLRQHLTGVRAVAEVCGARVEGAELRSQELTFVPGAVKAGAFEFAVGSAGSAGLVLQALLPVLWHADGPSTVQVSGGTHNPSAPPADFLMRTLAPVLATMGFAMELSLDQHGFYPAGGGAYRVSVTPGPTKPLSLLERGAVQKVEVTSIVANLPANVGQRELTAVKAALPVENLVTTIETVRSPGPGNAVVVAVESEAVTEVFTAFGRRGRPAEDVGQSVAESATAYLDSGVPVGPHLADQLMLPLAIAGGQFSTGALTEHSRTAIGIIAQFLERSPRVIPQDDQRLLVECSI
ncbi:MAG: RNA 3'-terminal phosphate cyclase [Myxococcota bacterium]